MGERPAGPTCDRAADGHSSSAADSATAAAAFDAADGETFRALLDGTDLLVVSVDLAGRIVRVNDALAHKLGRDPAALVGRSWFDEFLPRGEADLLAERFAERFRADEPGPLRFSSELLTESTTKTIAWTAAAVRDPTGVPIGSTAIGSDVTDHVDTARARDQLAAAVEASADAVMITDPAGRILYVNSAFERASGYAREEALGQNPRFLASGRQSPEFYATLWATLLAGRAWHGEIVDRRKDGTEYTQQASITPVVDGDTLLSYVAVQRDVTSARALDSSSSTSPARPDQISSMIADLSAGETAESTALAIAERMLSVPGAVIAAIHAFSPGQGMRCLAAVGRDGVVIRRGDITEASISILRSRVSHLRTHASRGPWTERWDRFGPSPLGPSLSEFGVRRLAVAPMSVGGRPVGIVEIGATDERAGDLEASLPTLASFGRLAGLLLGSQLGISDAIELRRAAIARIIDRRAFRPVFQPIVDLLTHRIVGYEALTRFTGRMDPEATFAEAAAVGLGVDLEVATANAAISAAARLPADAWLALNVSPAALAEPGRLAYPLWKAGRRPIVLELTEHDEIKDYCALRAQLQALEVPVRIAVDDAGSGFASLRHILELRPAIIKLDRLLIAGLDGDPVRRGLVVGLRHFGSAAGAVVLAEGIETEAERMTLLELGVELGQGYLLGRPKPAQRVAGNLATLIATRATRSPTGLAVGSPATPTAPAATPVSSTARADRALHRAKPGGRKRVAVAHSAGVRAAALGPIDG